MELHANTIHDAYEQVARFVLAAGECSSPRDHRTIEVRHMMFHVHKPHFEPITTRDEKRNEVIKRYCEREHKMYLSGELDAAKWRDKASKFWWELRNPDDTINSNYWHLTGLLRDAPGEWAPVPYRGNNGITQFEWALQALTNDPSSRQAVMHFHRPMHQWIGNRDFPCTMYGNFHIRYNHLHYTVHMRSQDVVKGLTYDMPFFVWQQLSMAEHLNLPVGTYTHVVDSMHIYSHDIELVERMIGDDNH